MHACECVWFFSKPLSKQMLLVLFFHFPSPANLQPSHAGGVVVRRVCCKMWVCRKHLSILCNSPRSSQVSGASASESLCGPPAPWASHTSSRGGPATGRQDERNQRQHPQLRRFILWQPSKIKNSFSECRHWRCAPTSASSSLVMLVRVGRVFCGCLDGNGLLDGTFLRARQRTIIHK